MLAYFEKLIIFIAKLFCQGTSTTHLNLTITFFAAFVAGGKFAGEHKR